MRKRYILIAEDDADDRFLLETAFRDAGLDDAVVFVENGVELLKHLKARTENGFENGFPSFILLDLNMPKKDGREVLKEIKEHEWLRTIPVVVFTTTKNENEIRRCYELGANSYVVKPVSFDELVRIISLIRDYWFNVAALPA